MDYNTEMQRWIANSLFILGVLIFLIGLCLIIQPSKFLQFGQSMGKWISTEKYFNSLDRPHYQERFIYKHHLIFGSLIIIGAIYTLYMLVFNVTVSMILVSLPEVINYFWSDWFYSTAYYLFIAAKTIALIVGIIILIRPSYLKGIETYLNKWIISDDKLMGLDEAHEISTNILPGSPRLFGLAVVLGGLYIMLSMAIMMI